MSSVSLKDLFTPIPVEVQEEEKSDDVICLHFRYGTRNFLTTIDVVKEIIDFPLIIPFPVDVGATLGVMNLRGTIVPIMDPERHFLSIQEKFRSRSQEEFARLKLRLIVFEPKPGMIMALPVTEIGKSEIPADEMDVEATFVRIGDLPYEKFDLSTIEQGNT